MDLATLLPANLFAALVIFMRLGGAMMLLPGFGEAYVPPRYRLLLAVLFSMLMTPVLAPELPVLPSAPSALAVILGSELFIGLFIGTIARILITTLESAGMIVSFQLGLSAAQVFNPLAASQGSVPGAFYSMLGVLLIFLTDTHHLLLRGLVDSYAVFTPGVLPPIGDLSDTIARVVAGSFRLAMELSAPFIVLGTIFSIALGIIARLVPQFQLLFVTQPLQIVGGLVVFVVALVTGMRWFLDVFIAELGHYALS
jgi:flagellar biosynthetic protein FliR